MHTYVRTYIMYVCIYSIYIYTYSYTYIYAVSDACMCPHTAIYIYMSAYCYTCVLILLHVCPHTAIHVSSYYYMCVLILLYMCPHTTTCVSTYCYTCVLILLHVCPHTAIHVSSYCYMRVLILLYMRPHTAISMLLQTAAALALAWRLDALHLHGRRWKVALPAPRDHTQVESKKKKLLRSIYLLYWYKSTKIDVEDAGRNMSCCSQFTCFTGTKVQILTQIAQCAKFLLY
jgi:hypothetical protein